MDSSVPLNRSRTMAEPNSSAELFGFGRTLVVVYSMLFCNLSPDDWLASHETLCSDVRVNLISKYIISVKLG